MSSGKRSLSSSIALRTACGHGERVRPRRPVDGDDRRRLPVHASDLLVRQGAELDARDVAEAHDRAVRIQAHDDLRELLRRQEPPLGADRVRELLALRRRLGADLSRGVHRALLLDRARQVGDRQAELRELIGVDPDAHRVLGRAEVEDLPDAVDPVERVVDVDERVVPEEEAVVRPLRRVERDEDERRALRLAVGEPELVHLDREARQRLRDAVLGVHLVGVAVGADVERDPHGDRAVVRVDRLQVQHVLDAVHLLLDRRRDRLLDRERVGARVRGLDLDERRDDVGKLLDGQAEHRDEPAEDRQDRDDDRDDGPVDEEAGHGVTSRRCPSGAARPVAEAAADAASTGATVVARLHAREPLDDDALARRRARSR